MKRLYAASVTPARMQGASEYFSLMVEPMLFKAPWIGQHPRHTTLGNAATEDTLMGFFSPTMGPVSVTVPIPPHIPFSRRL